MPAYTHPLVSAASFLLTRACAASSPPLRSCLNTPRKLSSMASMNDSSSVRGRLRSSVGIANVHQFTLLPPRLLTDTVIKADEAFSATCEPRASQYAQPAHGSQSSLRRTDSGGTASAFCQQIRSPPLFYRHRHRTATPSRHLRSRRRTKHLRIHLAHRACLRESTVTEICLDGQCSAGRQPRQ